ncbi:hypothetical protein F4778DRAFT_746386 [Xylariomycetidae sp. FL2044]|nr:hypothetical protein F4778DRAFT_746386 [Xylariomycetidae sp. FL2044]
MPNLDDTTYSRERVIAAVRDYYKFLTHIHLRESEILEPPETGWPSINAENFAPLGKTNEVLELLRHLPYIRRWNGGSQSQGAPDACFVDYQHEFIPEGLGKGRLDSVKMITDGADTWDDTPSDVVGLLSAPHDGNCFLLDTKVGIIYWVNCQPWLEKSPSREPVNTSGYGEEVWRSSPAWAVEDFFELLKDQFRAQVCVATSEETVRETYGPGTEEPDEYTEAIRVVQRIYREHGWPDLAIFDKHSCLEEVQEYLEEHCGELMY